MASNQDYTMYTAKPKAVRRAPQRKKTMPTGDTTPVYYCHECADRYKWPKDNEVLTNAECTVCGEDEHLTMFSAEWSDKTGMIVTKPTTLKTPVTSSIRERVQARVARGDGPVG